MGVVSGISASTFGHVVKSEGCGGEGTRGIELIRVEGSAKVYLAAGLQVFGGFWADFGRRQGKAEVGLTKIVFVLVGSQTHEFFSAGAAAISGTNKCSNAGEFSVFAGVNPNTAREMAPCSVQVGGVEEVLVGEAGGRDGVDAQVFIGCLDVCARFFHAVASQSPSEHRRLQVPVSPGTGTS